MKRQLSTVSILVLALLVSGIAIVPVSTAFGDAFPGAVGFGTSTDGGRGGRIIEVINLNDSGSGSFRAACEASGARIVVFRTGGTIRITSNIKIQNPHITIAGQTAPGDGILIRGAGLGIETHDVIVRGIRIRVGDGSSGPSPDNRDGLVMDNDSPMYNVVVDHCSISWAIDENMSIWHPNAHDITISNSIISEALYDSMHSKGPHSMGLIVGPDNSRISIIGNLMAHNQERNPRLKGTDVAVINNVVYDRGYKDVDIGGGNSPQDITIVGNHFIRGPSYMSNDKPVSIRSDTPSNSRIYANDNIYNSYTSGAIYNSSTYIVDSAPTWPSGLVAKPSNEVLDWVLSNVGASPANRDPVDARIINQVRNRNGRIIDRTSEVGGWPSMATGTAPADSDHDGMPNSWEIDHGLNPNDSDDASDDRDGDGYTNVEEYINSLIETGDTGGGSTIQIDAPRNLTVSSVIAE